MNRGGLVQTALLRVLLSLVMLLLAACAGNRFTGTPDLATLPPIQIDQQSYTAASALLTVHTPDLLGMSDEMREFVDHYVRHGNQRQRLLMLHQSLLSPALVGIDYDPAADGTASQVFQRGAANCLSYAHLFIAMARYAGLDARYLSVAVRPEWQRHGEQVALRRHVSVAVKLRKGGEYVVDIYPVSQERIADTRVITDREAKALYHSNLAMDELLQQRHLSAYAQSLRSLDYAPRIDYLWTNLGAVYRQAGEDSAAEQVYKTALALNDDSPSAMNNLAVLYEGQGNAEQAEYWGKQVLRHRQRNPYYHYYLGREAEQEGLLPQAIAHVRRAVELKPSDAEFYFRLAKLYHATDQAGLSIQYAEEAIARSRLLSEREQYQQFLARLNNKRVAALAFPGA